MYQEALTPHFEHTDAGGIVFFANLFKFSHIAYEGFVQKELGFKWNDWFLNPVTAIPIRHAQADYKAPLLAGVTYQIWVELSHIGESSFTIKYHFRKEAQLHATVELVHACLDIKTKTKASIPTPIRQALEKYKG